ncbi:unnamed protein product [Parnassius apollo]|uniref:(apollo) hypothetical protein n=1 Tax=Parnassius apollo TaxID=110799 RepID=A0A8S3YAD7_PARAO|nr:unnamed protein product [Parnassius apollo]
MILHMSLVVLTFLLVILYHSIRKNTRRWKNLSKFPGNPPLPLIGNALEIGFDADEASSKLMDMWRKYGKGNFRLTFGSEEWVLLTDADDVKIILSHPTEIGKPVERNAAMKPFFGNSVSTSEGERWRSTRKLMSPSFSYKTLANRIDVVNIYCERLFDIFDDYVDKGSVDMYRYLRPFMFDILCNSLMGVNLNLLHNPDHHYLQASAKVIKIVTVNYFSYWRNIRPLFVLTSYYREMMATIKTLRDTSTDVKFMKYVMYT